MDTEQAPAAEDVEALKAALAEAHAQLAEVRAQRSDDQALIAHLKLQIAKLNRERFGSHAERTARLLDQMELQLEELEATATADEIAAETAAAQATMGRITTVAAFTRKRPARKPFPNTCFGNGSSCRDRVHVCAAAARACPSWARISLRRWR